MTETAVSVTNLHHGTAVRLRAPRRAVEASGVCHGGTAFHVHQNSELVLISALRLEWTVSYRQLYTAV